MFTYILLKKSRLYIILPSLSICKHLSPITELNYALGDIEVPSSPACQVTRYLGSDDQRLFRTFQAARREREMYFLNRRFLPSLTGKKQ